VTDAAVGRWRTLGRNPAATVWSSPSGRHHRTQRAARRSGRPSYASSTELGPRWVRATRVRYGRQRSPVDTSGSEEPQVAALPPHAAGMMRAGDSDCGPEGRGSSPSVTHTKPHPWGRALSRAQEGQASPGGLGWLLVAAVSAGRSQGQGGAPCWTNDLDAGEDRRRIGGEKTRTTSRSWLTCTHPGPRS
jgi:hypothetical protein